MFRHQMSHPMSQHVHLTLTCTHPDLHATKLFPLAPVCVMR
jgi:hypothetical protein